MQQKPVARRHHFVPQSYLGRFTDNGTKTGFLCVLEIETKRAFRTSPKNVAVEQDFNRIDSDDYPPDHLENQFSAIEAAASNATERIVGAEVFPNDEDYSAILALMGLLAVRNPLSRASFNAARDHSLRIIGGILAADEHLFRNHVKNAIAAGADIPDDISFEDFRAFIENDNYDIEFSSDSNLRVEIGNWENIIHVLHERHYSLILAPEDGPQFITCDHPVALACKSGLSRPLGLGTRHTDLFFPLSPRAGLYGVYEGELNRVVRAKPGSVATMNKRVFSSAMRHVYSAGPKFSIWEDGQVVQLRMDV